MINQLQPKDIVKAAWKISGSSQEVFAKSINKSQPMLSKYISGAVLPPSDILIHCMNKCGLLEQIDISAAVLAERVRVELADVAYSGARAAINQILDSISLHSSMGGNRNESIPLTHG